MRRSSESLSTSEMYVIGIKKYGDIETGLENWKEDLYKFVSPEFHDMLNSSNIEERKNAINEVSIWVSTNEASFFFRNTWGSEPSNKLKALQYLHHAQLLERKFNDQFIIQIVNHSVRTCLENKYHFLE